MNQHYDARFAVYKIVTPEMMDDPAIGKVLRLHELGIGDEAEIEIGIKYVYEPGEPEKIVPGRPDLYDMGEPPKVDFEGFWFVDTGDPVPEWFLSQDDLDSFYELIVDTETGNWF